MATFLRVDCLTDRSNTDVPSNAYCPSQQRLNLSCAGTTPPVCTRQPLDGKGNQQFMGISARLLAGRLGTLADPWTRSPKARTNRQSTLAHEPALLQAKIPRGRVQTWGPSLSVGSHPYSKPAERGTRSRAFRQGT